MWKTEAKKGPEKVVMLFASIVAICFLPFYSILPYYYAKCTEC
jgi:hypothetical protein